MKKIILLILLLAATTRPVFAQLKLSGLTTMYGGNPTDDSPVLAIAMSTSGAAYRSSEVSNEALSNKLLLKGAHAENFTLGEVFDTAGVHVMVLGHKALSEGLFEFRVLENAAAEVVPWTTVGAQSPDSLLHMPKSYLGNYKTGRGNFLVIDLRRKGADSALSTAVVFFRKTQPTLASIYLGNEMKQFMKRLTDPGDEPDSLEQKKWQANYKADELDTATGLPKQLTLNPDQNSVIFYLREQVKKGELLQYQVLRNGKVYTDWKKNDFDNGFVWLTNLPPGRYELRMRFVIQKENVTTYPFIIKPRWDQTLTFKFIAGGLIAAFFGFLLLLFRLRRQRQKLRRTKAQRDKAQTELRSIYSQLNPHFIFNALSSIQGLINKNETENAHHYLSTFSRLLRDSLANNEKDRVPLSTELQMLDTYLQLEQLRFHFAYAIETDENIPAPIVELPSLLLQPLVENAIKHGVASLYEKGVIQVRFSRKENDLVASITDNGKGCDSLAETRGFGLKLTKERIRLLNEADREHPISLSFDPGKGKGTTVIVHFKNWL